jgi:dTDP-glucose 4,6-dehydratase
MKRALLTGSAGFVGHHILAHLLVNTDWHIVCTDSFRHHGTSERINDVLDSLPSSRSRVTVVTHDLTTPWSSVGIQRLGVIDYIVNVASESHVDRSISDPVPFVQNNVSLVLNMLELARVLKPKAFIQISTDEVYGAVPAGRPSLEWDSILPSNPYAASKAAQEAIAISYWRTYGVPLVILNCMNLIGERQDPEKFIPKTIGAVLRCEPVTIHASAGVTSTHIDRRLISSRCYLHARNLADAILFTLRKVEPQMHPRAEFPARYNVVGNAEVDNLMMAERIAEFVGSPLRVNFTDFHSTRPGHDLRYAMDGTRLAQLGWSAPVPLWASLKKTVEWSIAHPEWLGTPARSAA